MGLALVPTYPKSTNVASETLRIRHEGFSPSNATHSGILTSDRSTFPSGIGFTAIGTLPYPPRALRENFKFLIFNFQSNEEMF
jgi:hypothetical protein